MANQADDMMDEFDRWIVRIIKAIIIVALLAALLAVLEWRFAPDPPRREPRQFTAEEKRWVTERLKYHGISGAVIEDGQHYFYRDGKRCRL